MTIQYHNSTVNYSESVSELRTTAFALIILFIFMRASVEYRPVIQICFDYLAMFPLDNPIYRSVMKAGFFGGLVSVIMLKHRSADALLNGNDKRREIQTFKLGNSGFPEGL